MAVVVASTETRTYPGAMLTFLAIAGGLCVANLCYAQPLAEAIARDFETTAAGMSSALVGTQAGYAIGMLLLVPLGDIRERRGTIVTTLLGGAVALLVYAAAPSLLVLTVAAVLVGIGCSAAQMIVPFAVSLVPPEQRGRAVGTVMSGLLAGVMLSRVASGAIGAIIGWRLVFVAGACVMVALVAVLRATLPVAPPSSSLSYRSLLASLFTIARREPVLRACCMVGALSMASFSTFWSTLAFHLAHSSIGGTSTTAGLLGGLGVAGLIVAPIAGRLAMRVPASRVNLGALAVVAAAFAVFATGSESLIAIGAGVVLLDAGTRASQLTNQTVFYGLAPAERNRINAIYMVTYFVGGALGTALAAQALRLGGWYAVCATGGTLALLAMLPLRRVTSA